MSARQRFRKAQRLAGTGVFKAVMDARARVECGAFAAHARPSDAPRSRVGISIGKRVGCAAHRNRIKRLLREAYRTSLSVHPSDPYDIVLVVRPHAPLTLEEYRSRLIDALATLHALWTKRANRRRTEAASADPAADTAVHPRPSHPPDPPHQDASESQPGS